MTGFDTEFTELFRDETARRLDQMDNLLLEIESGDADADVVNSLFRHAHTIKGAAGMLGFDDVRALAHGAEDVLARVRDAERLSPEIAAPLLRATAAMRVSIAGSGEPIDDVLADLGASQGSRPAARTGIPATPAAPVAGPAPPWPCPSRPEARPRGRPPGMQRRHRCGSRPTRSTTCSTWPARSCSTGARLAHSLGHQAQLSQDVADLLGAGERMLDDLKDTAVAMRTLPLEVITAGLPRVVRDLARAAGKEVEFAVSGADTELDRVILESLSEPLTHLLRNAVVHGIEPPAEREQAGKPPQGRLELRAEPRGSLVEIVVADDGRGVSPEVIEEAGREWSLAEVLARPGFSTAGEVTDLAGRGVGLDAVKAYASSLGGGLEVRSEPGQGMEVILLLPLALALGRGAGLRARRRGVRRGPGRGRRGGDRDRDQPPCRAARPCRSAAGRCRSPTSPRSWARPRRRSATDSPGIVISSGGRRAVVTCDALLGAEEVVIKPLGPLLAGVRGYLGASILGDGRIALLVEPATLTDGPRRARELRGPGPGTARGTQDSRGRGLVHRARAPAQHPGGGRVPGRDRARRPRGAAVHRPRRPDRARGHRPGDAAA